MHTALFLLATLPIFAQAPPTFDEAFFKGDPKAIMVTCADKARTLDPKDSRLLAEYGRAYLVSGNRSRAEEAFKRAINSDPRDGETHRLIGLAWLKAGFHREALKAFQLMVISDPKGRKAFAKAAVNLVDLGYFEEGELLMIRSRKIGSDLDASKSNKELFDSLERRASETDFIKLKPSGEPFTPNRPNGPLVALDIKALLSFVFDGWDCVDFGRAALRMKQTDLAARWFALAVASRPKEERIWNAVALAYADGGALIE